MFRKFVAGKHAIALGGSLAKGNRGSHSGIDVAEVEPWVSGA